MAIIFSIIGICATSSTKPKYIQFTMMQNREKQQTFTFKKLETAKNG